MLRLIMWTLVWCQILAIALIAFGTRFSVVLQFQIGQLTYPNLRR